MDLSSRVKRNENIAYRIIDAEALIVNPKDSLIYPLNSVGTRIWELLDGKRSCCDIINIINDEFEADKIIIQSDILIFIKDLLDKELAFLV